MKYFMNSRDLFLALKKMKFHRSMKVQTRRNCKFQFQIRNCNFQRQILYINTAFSNSVNIMLEVLFIVETGTTSQLTSCWSTFMHRTSSYDAQSKCPHNVECAKHRENEGRSFGKCWTWFWAAPSRLSFLTCAAHDLGWDDRPMDLPSEVLFLAAQFMYFFEENAEVCSIFLCKNRNAWSNLDRKSVV